MIEVVLNRYTQNAAVAPATIQKNLGKAVFAAIPEDSASHAAALTAGKPLILAAPSATSPRALHELVRKMQQTQLLQKLAGLKKPSRAQVLAANRPAAGTAGGAGSGAKEQTGPRV